MTTEIDNLPCGTVQVKVCERNICVWGWVSSMHLVPTKENQLKERLELELNGAVAT